MSCRYIDAIPFFSKGSNSLFLSVVEENIQERELVPSSGGN